MPAWIDYKALRLQLSFEAVLRHYGVELHLKGDQHTGFCPLPQHQGNRNSPSFSANMKRKIFQCFGCKACGNVLDFATLMENLSPENPRNVQTVAGNLQKRFLETDGITAPRERKPGPKPKQERTPDEPDMFPPATQRKTLVNQPLDFELKELDGNHPYLKDRGFMPETIAEFGVGFCQRGYLKDRIAIPLHDNDGKLIGYAGRTLADSGFTAENPKYKLPGARERGGISYQFQKSLFLYNGHSIKEPVHDLIVVEGFASVWWLHQHGYQNVVAIMGSHLSPKQAELLVEKTTPEGILWLMPDGDHAGVMCGNALLAALSRHRACRWAKLEQDRQPTDCTASQLASHLPLRNEAEEKPPERKRNGRTLKLRLMEKEIAAKQAITELAQSFPTLRSLNVRAASWDATAFDVQAAGLSAGGRAAAQFILRVWHGHQEWKCGEFNVVEALDLWDSKHRDAFLAWASDPWWV